MANRNSKKWLWTLVVLGILIAIGVIVFHPNKPKLGPPTVGYDTTRLTGPLRPDGTVDYIAALNQMYSKGVTPDNNAAVLVIRAFGPEMIPAEIRNEAYRLLWMDPLPAKGEYFITLDAFALANRSDFSFSSASSTAPKGEAKLSPRRHKSLTIHDAQNQFKEAAKGPWTAEKYPALAGWLKANEVSLDLAAEASHRPKFYLPVPSSEDSSNIMSFAMYSLQFPTKLAETLVVRAMFKAGRSDLPGAAADLLAARRLARLMSWQYQATGRTTETMACMAANRLLADENMNAELARKILADIESLDPLPSETEVFLYYNRFLMLDIISYCSAQGTATTLAKSSHRGPHIYGDWEATLRNINKVHDELQSARKLKTYTARAAARDKVIARIETLRSRLKAATGRDSIIRRILKMLRLSRRRFDNWEAWMQHDPENAIIAIFLQIGVLPDDLDEINNMKGRLTLLAAALAAHKAERGEYPAALAELSPDYLATIPNDLFIEKPLHYTRTEGGYVLYSVGPDMTDDGGDEDEDDIVLKVE